MASHILIPVALEHEPIVDRKIALARALLDPGGKITLLTVLESIPGFVAELVTVKPENRLTDRIISSLKEVAGAATDIACMTAEGKPGVQIVEVAEDQGCDLIIVGAHAPGAMDYFLGSTAARVARRARCSVHILR